MNTSQQKRTSKKTNQNNNKKVKKGSETDKKRQDDKEKGTQTARNSMQLKGKQTARQSNVNNATKWKGNQNQMKERKRKRNWTNGSEKRPGNFKPRPWNVKEETKKKTKGKVRKNRTKAGNCRTIHADSKKRQGKAQGSKEIKIDGQLNSTASQTSQRAQANRLP